MTDVRCPKCHQTVGAAQAAFCPFCGEKLQQSRPELSAALDEKDPVKKHDLLLELQQQNPDSLEVAEEILHLGRLYERGKKGADFSVIKCFLLNIYLEPETIRKRRRGELRQEIFSHPDLDRCLALCDDRDAFVRRYLTRLSEEFIRLFLRGSMRYMRSLFGHINEAKASKYLAQPAYKMLNAMANDEALDSAQRTLLAQSFYAAFQRQLNGDTRYLDELLAKHGLSVQMQ